MGMLTNILGLSEAFVLAAKGNYQKLADRSVTELIAPVRQRMLMERYGEGIVEDVSDKIWIILGQACHYILEQFKAEGSLVEYGFVITVHGIGVGMKPDLVTPIAMDEYLLTDIKTTSVYSVKSGEPKIEWEKQTNLYAHGLRLKGYKVTSIRIEAILRDWSRASMIRNSVQDNYPNGFRKGEYPKHNVVIIDVPVWSDQKCKEYLEKRVRLFESSKHLSDDELPFCTEEERWVKNNVFKVVTMSTGSTVQGGSKFKTRTEAQEFLNTRRMKKGATPAKIIYQAGVSNRCQFYCPVKDHCNQYNTELSDEPF